MVIADQQRLQRDTRNVVDWANAYVAHRGAPLPTSPTYRDLRIAINAVTRVNNKYAVLLNELGAKMPPIPESWESVFEVPWVTRRRRRLRRLFAGRAKGDSP